MNQYPEQNKEVITKNVLEDFTDKSFLLGKIAFYVSLISVIILFFFTDVTLPLVAVIIAAISIKKTFNYHALFGLIIGATVWGVNLYRFTLIIIEELVDIL